MVWIALVSTFAIAMLGASLGSGVGAFARRNLGVLVCFATGALLAVTAFDIIPESRQVLSWPGVGIAAILGFALLGTINRYVFEACPSCGIAHLDQERLRHDRYAFTLLAVALGAHCLLDGMAVAAGSGLNNGAGNGVTLGVLLHKLPEGFALALLLVNAGHSYWGALGRCAAIQSATLAGGALGLMVLGPATPKAFMGATFAFVGGGFLFLVANAVRGVLTDGSGRRARIAIGIQVAGFALTGLLLLVCGS